MNFYCCQNRNQEAGGLKCVKVREDHEISKLFSKHPFVCCQRNMIGKTITKLESKSQTAIELCAGKSRQSADLV